MVQMSLDQAKRLIREFKEMIPNHCLVKWKVVGSVRRGKRRTVGDVEVAVIPAHGKYKAMEGLFEVEKEGNLFWQHLDMMVESEEFPDVRKGRNKANKTCWGDTNRLVSFKGRPIEIYSATPDNWGVVCVVRTGPKEFSEAMVTIIRAYGYCSRHGFHMHPIRQDKSVTTGYLPMPDEESFFKLARLAYIKPSQRGLMLATIKQKMRTLNIQKV